MSSNLVSLSEPLTPTAPRASHPSLRRILAVLILFLALVGGSTLSARAITITFTAEELLGKPTNNSISINIVPASAIQYYYEYDVDPVEPYAYKTGNITATAGQPSEVTITGLTPNTRYYYRMVYDGDGAVGDGDFEVRAEHSFWTQRVAGSTFTFTVTSDSHQNFNTAEQNAMTNILNEHPDFHIDLGDTFLLDGSADQAAVNNKYLAYREPLYFDKIGSSVPIFLTPGNHEDEEGWNLDDSFSLAQASIQARKLYFPTPINDGFYSGNTDILAAINAGTYGDQYREDYYAWTWGDALFMVIDEFQYTMHNPYGSVAGEGSDDPKTCEYSSDPNCQWNWTLGAQQYEWFKQTLENSTAKYRFIFSHNMLGGKLTVAGSTGQPGYVRGGCEAAPYFEWGGKNADGTEGFADRRTATYGAGAVPLRQLMMDNGVSAYFHGHDHQYVYETCDDMVYQEVPSPGMGASGFAEYTEGDHGTYNTVKILPNSGHLRITVTPTQATVDYISSAIGTNGTINYTYTIAPNGPSHTLTTAISPEGAGTITPAAGDHSYTEGATVDVTASANTGYAFDHWSGDCSDSGACSVTMDADKTVTANFTTVPTYVLTTAVSPAGTGTISPASGAHNEGAVVNVTATPNTGYAFTEWSGACTGTGTCSVTMDAAKAVTANFTQSTMGVVTQDGAASSGTANSTNTVSFAHTTGAGADRLLLVGVSWNCGTTDRTISSVTFTPSGGGDAITLAEVLTQPGENSSGDPRYSAIYSLLNPPSGQAGTVTVTFSGSVSNGIVAGAANFAGVNQTDPLGTPDGDTSTSGSAPTVTLIGLSGNELVFDNVFQGGSSSSQTLTPAAGQTQLWTGFAGNARGSASTEQAAGSSVTMSWTAISASVWAIAAVPINPAAAGPTHNLTVAVDPDGSGTTSPTAGVHAYAEGSTIPITANAASGYIFDHWSGDCSGVGACSVTMTEDKSVTAHFVVDTTIDFTGEELLGRPEATSISVKVVPDAAISLYYEYGTEPGVYTQRTATMTAAAAEAKTAVIGCLIPNTRYYYRMRYSADGGTTWVARPELSFWTQRAPGSTFTFDITTDSHINILLGNQSNWTSTMNGVVADAPDFLIDLGDTFAMDNGTNPGAPTYGNVPIGDTATAEQKYKNALPTFNKVSGSAAIFLTPGNHEQQEAWHLTAANVGGNPANSLPVMGKNAEKKYFLNPLPNAFYSGDTNTYSYLSPDQYKQDYYAWTWGDALFVVITPFWTTTTRPYTTSTGGGEEDTTGTLDRWLWTLGQDQFNWLKTTLQNSTAKYKFVFSHQIVGGNALTNQVNYGHGGVDSANYVEWGGYNIDGTTFNWSTKRSGWGDQPIRQLMEANHVTAFFHGHDHQMAYEILNGMVYQATPSGSFSGSFGIYTTGGNSGKTIWADSTQGPGHLKVTVSPSQTTVDFIRYNAAAPGYTPAYSYTMSPQPDPGQHNLTVIVDGDGATDPAVGPHAYTTGNVIGVTATPGAGYVFDHWSGACTGSGACSITMDTDKMVTAHFAVRVAVAITKPSVYPVLTWTHQAAGVDHYAVYRSTTEPYFTAGAPYWRADVTSAAATFTDSTADLTVGGNSYYYLVGPVNGCSGVCGNSNRTGAFVFGLVPGSSTP